MSFPKRLPGGLPAGSTKPAVKVRKLAYSADELARILACGWTGKQILRKIRRAGLDLYLGQIWMSHLARGFGHSKGVPEIHAAIVAKLRKLEAGDDSPLTRDEVNEEDDAA